jgi:alpha-1,2-mannosyltransferase
MIIFSFVMISVLRIFTLYKFYHAPIDVYTKLRDVPPTFVNVSTWDVERSKYRSQAEFMRRELVTCVGKEWYRFPSQYLLPSAFKIGFTKSGFTGLLPKPYMTDEALKLKLKQLIAANYTEYLEKTRTQERFYHQIVPNVNNLNKEEVDAYTDEYDCDYFIDTLSSGEVEPEGWVAFYCAPFLDASNTKTLTRMFYFGEKSWLRYCIFAKRIN